MADKAHIRDDAEKIILVLFIKYHRIIEIRSKKYLRSRTFSSFALLFIERFFQEFRTLLENEFVQLRKICGIIPDRIFHKKNGLHTDFVYVMLRIDPVLEQLDYSYDKVGISMPAEHVVYSACILKGQASVYLFGKMRKQHERNHASFLFQ